jgi:hypothetical protein
VLYVHTGTDSTSRLVMYQDTGVTGLPLTHRTAATCRSWWMLAAGSFSDFTTPQSPPPPTGAGFVTKLSLKTAGEM